MISSHPRWNSEYRLSGAPLIMSFNALKQEQDI